ncbi:MAG: hypothetical protein A4E25_01878 [Methanobacterium sp. PtaB.Bin024]|nr:MAG: hypothetical protein A4E25_01878 [Methanobacterium sp. PtaB.Bin024]
MVKTLPLIVVVIGIIVPLIVFSVIHMLPAFIGSLKVVVITLSTGTFTALLAGLPAVALGAVLSIFLQYTRLIPSLLSVYDTKIP